MIVPGRRVGVLEIGHEDARAGIERIDDHLAVGRPGDLDAAVVEVGRDRRHGPVAFADGAGLGQEIGQHALVEELLALGAPAAAAPGAAALKVALQIGEEGDRLGRQHAAHGPP